MSSKNKYKTRTENLKKKRQIYTRLMTISLLVDDYIYRSKPISANEAQTYAKEIAALKLQCRQDVRSLQVIEKLTLFMNSIIKEQSLAEVNVSNNLKVNYTMENSNKLESTSSNTKEENVNINIRKESEMTQSITDHNAKCNVQEQKEQVHNKINTPSNNIAFGGANSNVKLEKNNTTSTNNKGINNNYEDNQVTQMEVSYICIDLCSDETVLSETRYKDTSIDVEVECTISNLSIKESVTENNIKESHGTHHEHFVTNQNNKDISNINRKEKNVNINIHKESEMTQSVTDHNAKCNVQEQKEQIHNKINTPSKNIAFGGANSNVKLEKNKIYNNNKHTDNENYMVYKKNVGNNKGKLINKHNKVLTNIQSINKNEKLKKEKCNVANVPKNKTANEQHEQKKKRIRQKSVKARIDLSWVENIKYVREVSNEEYDPEFKDIHDDFWENLTLPGALEINDFDF